MGTSPAGSGIEPGHRDIERCRNFPAARDRLRRSTTFISGVCQVLFLNALHSSLQCVVRVEEAEAKACPTYATLCFAMKSAAGSLLIPGDSGASASPFTSFCFPPDSI